MWQDLMHLSISPFNLILRAVLVYLSILILLRISGKRQIGQMGASELVTILLISNAVQNSMNGGDNSLIGGLLLSVVLILLSMSIAYLSFRSRAVELIFQGTPRLLVHNGKPIEKALRAELLTQGDLRVLMRKQGVHHLNEVRFALLESDGTLSIVKTDDAMKL